jgi:beta-lactamase regulating signal transducer with metallopeptidase domain
MIPVATDFAATAFLFDTLVWTAALIALVLVLRRPVTRVFGAPTAYALWCLPMARLLLPPIELPSWAAPAMPAKADPAAPGRAVVEIDGDVPTQVPLAGSADPLAAESAFDLLAALGDLPLAEIALGLWLGGAAVFLCLRFSAYFALRAELLEGAREVGSTPGPLRAVRLIETSATPAPLAFGVLDPVIALPPGFMARVDREARDLALAHEIEHHRGHDLLINVLVQPLFALHWFNPLAHYGWLALRRDQEAACDARVLAARGAQARALYASVITSFAAGSNVAPNAALTAPMACPVLGDKSIIQRLRNLKMTEQQSSHPRFRKTGARLMLGTALLAVPLTASVTYAESLAPAVPAAPAAPPAPPAPPAMLESIFSLQAAPEAPPAPEAPLAPDAPEAPPAPGKATTSIVTIDPDTGETTTVDVKGKVRVEADEIRKMKVRGKDVLVLRDVDESEKDGVKARYETVKIVNRGNNIDDAEIELIMKEVREDLAEADRDLEEMRIELKAMEDEAEWAALAKEGRTVVEMECNSSSDDVATTVERKDGTKVVQICQSRIMAHALKGLEQARAAIADNPEIKGRMRRQILDELDEQIASWRKDAR